MATDKKVYVFVIAALVFIVYILVAAQPIPKETILTLSWIQSLDSEFLPRDDSDKAPEAASAVPLPFTLGGRFGYVGSGGALLLNRVMEGDVSLSPDFWAEYRGLPESIEIKSPGGEELVVLENPDGYPMFMDGRIFIISSDMTSLEEIGRDGRRLWAYDFEAPITAIDASGGYVLAGTLDGMIDLLDSKGNQVFPSFAPGASRIAVITACRLSSDASSLAVISGVDKQRFLFLERYGDSDYRVTHHSFLHGEGFRREVRMEFIDNDSIVVFEQEDGLGVFDVKSRTAVSYPLSGRIEAMDASGADGLFFFVSSAGSDKKRLTLMRLPDSARPFGLFRSGTSPQGAAGSKFPSGSLPFAVLLDAPFESETAFFDRRNDDIFIGGGNLLSSFKIGKR